MKDKFTRRRFLQSAGAAAYVGAGLALPGQAQAAANAAVTGSVPGKARMFPGCCAYSYRKLLASGQMNMQDFIHEMVKIGSVGADMTVYWFKSTDPAYLAELRHLAFKNGVPLSGAGCRSSMVQASADKRREVLADIKKWVDVTQALGAPHLRIFGGKLPHGATVKQATDWVVETMKPACEYAGNKGITLGIEDHSGVTQNADVCLEIMHRVNSPYAGINLDITHFTPTSSQDPYAQIKACIPYATQTHIRDHFDDGSPIDLDRVWKMFQEGGYKGYMSLEYEGKGEDPMTGIPRMMTKVRELCRKYSSA
ncbi:MAG TPA: sugar phosphate isomerase/epimerase family protein [Terriglobia bacterium]|nr:sugar phosphate isomerase/epimerase family protein [Terriglobia bacterium]